MAEHVNGFEVSDLSFARYYSFGQNDAQSNEASITAIESSLDSAYADFLKYEKNDIGGRIIKLEGEIRIKKDEKERAKYEIADVEVQKQSVEDKIDNLEKDKIRIQQGDGASTDYVTFGILALITVALTLYLFVFYSSTIYSAFYGDVNSAVGGFIRPSVFSEANSKGTGAVAIIVLSPFIFIGLGFLIHSSLKENEEREEKRLKPKFGLMATLVSFTFLFDALMAYKISEALHNDSYTKGLTDVQWSFGMIFSDINFYMVLAAGFVVYILWGFLLNNLLNKLEDMQPDKVLQYEFDKVNSKISIQKEKLSEVNTRLVQLNDIVKNCQDMIDEKFKKIAGYKGGNLIVDISRLKAMVGQFMNGWNSFINFKYALNKTTADQLMQKGKNTSDSWLDNKVNSLQSDN